MQLALTVGKVVKLVGGHLLRGSAEPSVQRLSTDTRTLQTGDLFVPLVGDRFDAHNFLEEAASQGACGALVSQDHPSSLPILIQVPDTLQALGRLAAYHRSRFQIPVVGITGSNGKTTTRAMLSSILSQRGTVHAPQKSYNNLIGVPLTIFELDPTHERAIFELGTNSPGEIQQLAKMTQPTVGVITNVGPTHLEGLGNVASVAEEKGSLLVVAQDAVLNADNPYTLELAKRVRGRCVCFGITNEAEVSASGISQSLSAATSPPSALLHFRLRIGIHECQVHMASLGKHHVSNALAAAGAAWLLGYSLDEIRAGLEAYTPVAMRTQLVKIGDVLFVNDAYNANPTSMQAALELTADLVPCARRIAVLGDMLELGASSNQWHQKVGQQVVGTDLDILVTVGDQAALIADAALNADFPASACHVLGSTEEAARLLLSVLRPGDLVLLKASRGMVFENILEQVRKG